MKNLVGGFWAVVVLSAFYGCSSDSGSSPNGNMSGSAGTLPSGGSKAQNGGAAEVGGSNDDEIGGEPASAGTANVGGHGGAGQMGGTGGTNGPGGGTGGGSEMPATAFVPNVPEEYVGQIMPPGLEVIGHTARESSINKEWLMAVKNTGTQHLCAIDVSFSFLDADGKKLGGATSVPLDIPLERGSNGTGGLTSCLAPGKVGMLKDTLSLQDVDVSKIAKVTHQFGALALIDAKPTDDIKVIDVQAVMSGTGQVFSGTLKNDTQQSVKNPSVTIYGVNAAGRPLFSSEAIELTSIAAGGSWMFKTSEKFSEPFASYAAFPRVTD